MREWMDRRRERKMERLIDRAQRGRMRSVVSNNPPLPPSYESEAIRLVELAPQALGENREEVRAIGQRLNQDGGMDLMRAVLQRAQALSVRQGPHYEYASHSIERLIDKAWDGIGSWMG